MMLKRFVMQVRGLVMVQFTTVYIQLTICLLRNVRRLLALITQTYRNALTLLNRPVNIVMLLNSVLAVKTKLVQLLLNANKVVLTRLERLLILVGLKSQENVVQPQQRAKSVRKQGKQVAKMDTTDK